MKTLLICDSRDATADILAEAMGKDCFRFNADLFGDYCVLITGDGFKISTPWNSIELKDVRSVLWRKPFNNELFENPSLEERYKAEEYRYLTYEIFNLAKANGAYALVEPLAERRFGKISQLRLASKFFKIPKWHLRLNLDEEILESSITKSLSSTPLDADSVLYTTDVSDLHLDRQCLWFLQDRIAADYDVTVCYVRGDIFAFRLDRAMIGGLDWRECLDRPESLVWEAIILSDEFASAIRAFMNAADLKFGRLDFLQNREGFWFLEINPNGQWAWLDIENKLGLLNSIVTALR